MRETKSALWNIRLELHPMLKPTREKGKRQASTMLGQLPKPLGSGLDRCRCLQRPVLKTLPERSRTPPVAILQSANPNQLLGLGFGEHDPPPSSLMVVLSQCSWIRCGFSSSHTPRSEKSRFQMRCLDSGKWHKACVGQNEQALAMQLVATSMRNRLQHAGATQIFYFRPQRQGLRVASHAVEQAMVCPPVRLL